MNSLLPIIRRKRRPLIVDEPAAPLPPAQDNKQISIDPKREKPTEHKAKPVVESEA